MKRTEKSRKKRAEIIAATRQILPRVDYKSLSVRMICDTCGISIGSFYHHFKNKEDLLTEILGEVDQYLLIEVQPLLTAPSEAENLRIFVHGFAEETKNSALAAGGNVLSTSTVPLPSDPEAREKELNRPLYQIPITIIQKGQASGEFNQSFSAEDAADILVTTLRGYSMDWSRRSFSYDFSAKVDHFFDFFLNALCASSSGHMDLGFIC